MAETELPSCAARRRDSDYQSAYVAPEVHKDLQLAGPQDLWYYSIYGVMQDFYHPRQAIPAGKRQPHEPLWLLYTSLHWAPASVQSSDPGAAGHQANADLLFFATLLTHSASGSCP